MDREYSLELVLRRALSCNRTNQLLGFGGIATAGNLKRTGGFYDGVIAGLAALYPRATFAQTREIDAMVDIMDTFRDVSINDVSDDNFNSIYETLADIVNRVIEQ